MGIEQIAFEIPKYIAKGLANGTFVRHGGVIRSAATGAVVKMLKEVPVIAPKTGNIIVKQLLIPIVGAVGVAGATIIKNHIDDIDSFITSKFRKNNSEIVYENITDFKSAKKNIIKAKKA